MADRVLRYLAESHDNGDPDCTVDEVFRISGSATQDATSACLVLLKRRGLVQAGSARCKWQISKSGLPQANRTTVATLAEEADEAEAGL